MTERFYTYAHWIKAAPDARVYRDAFAVLKQMPKDLSPSVKLAMHDALFRASKHAWFAHQDGADEEKKGAE